ncbi:MAG: 16S rRNA (adenine(1518)-N(6)/adenine(1519)-N(6))-dimethyltransferase RsmA [Gammaproteobacteria bacterium]
MHPRKRFGQNFLRDQAVIKEIAAAVAPGPNDHLVEIGPGQGALTRQLLGKTKRFDLIELDRDLVEILKPICLLEKQCFLHSFDVLRFDFREIYQRDKLRIVGNLPYNISTPLLFYLINFGDLIRDLHFMLQKEVAERIVASPGNKDYGRLSVMIQYHFSAEILFPVFKESFFPIPQVESAFIRLIPRPAETKIPCDLNAFSLVVREAFNQRRKTIQNSLKKLVAREVWAELNIDPKCRPEELRVEDYVLLSKIIS